MIQIPELSANELCEIFGVNSLKKDIKITRISLNSKEKSEIPFCFFAIKGEKFDGYSFIDEAVANGARVVVSEKKKVTFAHNIVVSDAKKALGLLAKHISKKTKNICVTGSAGKTTTTQMIKSVLSEKYTVGGTEGNQNNEIGVPLTLFKSLNNDYNAVELGMRGLGQIMWLSYVCEPEIAVITNIGSAHIEKLGGIENIYRAKSEIFLHTKKLVVVPSDDFFRKYSFGELSPIFIGNGADLECVKYTFYDDGIQFDIRYKKELICGFKIKSFSIHNINNALCAIAVGFLCGLTYEEIKNGLESYQGEHMREEIVKINGITIINDCYNASFESMKSAIFNLKKYCEIKNKIPNAVIGDMLELGRWSQELHYRIGEMAKDCGISKLVTIGKYGKYVLDGYMGGEQCKSTADAVKIIKSELGENDVLLIKASRAMGFEKILEEMRKENE